jgi:hypothetical protein
MQMRGIVILKSQTGFSLLSEGLVNMSAHLGDLTSSIID